MSNYSDESIVRMEKIKRMQALGVIAYANKYDKTHSISELTSQNDKTFRNIDEVSAKTNATISTAGRIVLFRSFGKIAFAHLQDATGQIQIMFSRENCAINTGKEVKTQLSEEMSAYKFAEKLIDLGDFIGVK
jgi:lysyl-tRNA synthetase class 2